MAASREETGALRTDLGRKTIFLCIFFHNDQIGTIRRPGNTKSDVTVDQELLYPAGLWESSYNWLENNNT